MGQRQFIQRNIWNSNECGNLLTRSNQTIKGRKTTIDLLKFSNVVLFLSCILWAIAITNPIYILWLSLSTFSSIFKSEVFFFIIFLYAALIWNIDVTFFLCFCTKQMGLGFSSIIYQRWNQHIFSWFLPVHIIAILVKVCFPNFFSPIWFSLSSILIFRA